MFMKEKIVENLFLMLHNLLYIMKMFFFLIILILILIIMNTDDKTNEHKLYPRVKIKIKH